jgi:hypothetical protein
MCADIAQRLPFAAVFEGHPGRRLAIFPIRLEQRKEEKNDGMAPWEENPSTLGGLDKQKLLRLR